MKALTKIWKKLQSEAGIPVSDIIDERMKHIFPVWEEEKTFLLRKFILCPFIHFDVVALCIE